MGKRGPAPQPSILKYIRGNPSKETLNSDEPTPDLVPETLSPPAWLDGMALTKWKECVPVLSRMRVLTEADTEPLARYCTLWEQWKVNYDRVKQIGGEITHLEADPTRNDGKLRIKYSQVAPWASQMTKLAVLLLRIEQEFGLTPSSRSQVTLHGKRDDDPLATFVKKRGTGTGG